MRLTEADFIHRRVRRRLEKKKVLLAKRSNGCLAFGQLSEGGLPFFLFEKGLIHTY